MKKKIVYLGEDGGMTGAHTKHLIVTLRKDGSISFRGRMDCGGDSEGFGRYSPPGRCGLRTIPEMTEALDQVVDDVGTSVCSVEMSRSLKCIALDWRSDLLMQFAQGLEDEQ